MKYICSMQKDFENMQASNVIHHGANVKRFREMHGLKQEALAKEMGGDWTQRKISLLEQKAEIGDDILEEVSRVLHVTPEAIKNFSEEATFNIISNTYRENSSTIHYSFNPIDKLLEMVEDNKKLYEQLIAAEKEKIEFLTMHIKDLKSSQKKKT